MSLNYETIVNVAKDTAMVAGNYLLECLGKDHEIEYKGNIDLVTKSDRMSQEIIYKKIKEKYPDHSILAEEDLHIVKNRELLWVIDPIDGTTNFSRALPAFCVSIAFLVEGIVRVGAIYIPRLDEMFSAACGSGSYLNKKRISVSVEDDLRRSLLATGFPYDRWDSENNNVNHFNKLIVRSLGIRRMGSAAVDMCYAAAGRFDGFWELKLKPWDTAAGSIIVKEAGGTITDFSGAIFDPFGQECLATNGLIHDEMMKVLKL